MINTFIGVRLVRYLNSDDLYHFYYNDSFTFEGEFIKYPENEIPNHIAKLIHNKHSPHSHVIDYKR